MKLLVGLGNPGRRHAEDRHNIGMMALDRIAAVSGAAGWRDRYSSEAADTRIGNSKVLLLKPQTYMNNSGMAVRAALDYFRIPLDDVIVLHDEIDLVPGKIRIRQGGGHAGHNGLRSIISHTGPEFIRVRLGIGHPGHRDRVRGHVLGKFSRKEREDWLEPLLDRIADNIEGLIVGNHAAFLNAIMQPQANRRSGRMPPEGSEMKPSAAPQDWRARLRAFVGLKG
ncbi:MAG: aminoacyl-tRNA hydrolase [Rhodobacteraceae bacterium]|nr:aminoacyl-tRNA hydrolase [Paracoccaceae bacterium]